MANKLTAVDEVRNIVTTILKEREEETARLAEAVAEEVEMIAKAHKAMETATTAGDVKEYQKAKAMLRDAEDAKEMHDARLEALNKKPLISKADYEKAVAGIYSEIASIDDQTKQKLAKLSEDMEAAVLALQEAINKANVVLNHLQHDVYRDADRRRDASGEPMYLPHEEKKIEKWDTINWGKAGVMHLQYAAYTGRKVQ